MELISIVVPVYNNEKYLSKCIDSILKQTYKRIEIILIDDGSEDNSLKICKDYEKKHENIRVFHNENNGVSRTRNIGIAKANGKYIGFVDSDDYIKETMYERLFDAINKNKTMIAACYMGKTNQNDKKENNEENSFLADCYETLFCNKNILGFVTNKLYNLEYIKEKKLLFDEKIHYCEDLMFAYEYMKNINNISIVPEELYYYRNNENGASSMKNIEKAKTMLDAYEYLIKDMKENEKAKKYIDEIYYVYVESAFRIQMRIKYKKDSKLYIDTRNLINSYYKRVIKSKNIKKIKKIKLYIRNIYKKIYERGIK